MAEYIVNSTDLTAVADAIRAKGEITTQLVFPDEFVMAIENISTSAEIKELYLYNSGDKCTAVTGGWGVTAIPVDSSYPQYTGVPTVEYDSYSVTLKQADGKSGFWHTVNKIDLSDYKTLIVNIKSRTGSGGTYVRFGARPVLTGYSDTEWAAVKSLPVGTTGSIALDVSSVSGEHYIGVNLYAESNVVLTQMRLISWEANGT